MAHVFAVTRAHRFQLAQIFVSRELRLADRDEQKRFNRSRLALGVTPVMDELMRGPIEDAKALDKTANAVELTDEQVDFLLKTIAPLSKLGISAWILSDLWDALETAKLVGQAPAVDAPPLDVASEDWLGEKLPAAGLKAV